MTSECCHQSQVVVTFVVSNAFLPTRFLDMRLRIQTVLYPPKLKVTEQKAVFVVNLLSRHLPEMRCETEEGAGNSSCFISG